MVVLPVPMNCPRCGRVFTPDFVPLKDRKVYCWNCTQTLSKARILQLRLVKQEFSLDKKDEEIAQKLTDFLMQEGIVVHQTTLDIVNALLEALVNDVHKKEAILAQLKKLQGMK